MVQNAAERKEDVRGVNAELGCSHIELRIVGNNNKLIYINFRITAHSRTNSRSHTSTPGVSRNLSRPHLKRFDSPNQDNPGRGECHVMPRIRI